jgi:hypothetical protein
MACSLTTNYYKLVNIAILYLLELCCESSCDDYLGMLWKNINSKILVFFLSELPGGKLKHIRGLEALVSQVGAHRPCFEMVNRKEYNGGVGSVSYASCITLHTRRFIIIRLVSLQQHICL